MDEEIKTDIKDDDTDYRTAFEMASLLEGLFTEPDGKRDSRKQVWQEFQHRYAPKHFGVDLLFEEKFEDDAPAYEHFGLCPDCQRAAHNDGEHCPAWPRPRLRSGFWGLSESYSDLECPEYNEIFPGQLCLRYPADLTDGHAVDAAWFRVELNKVVGEAPAALRLLAKELEDAESEVGAAFDKAKK